MLRLHVSKRNAKEAISYLKRLYRADALLKSDILESAFVLLLNNQLDKDIKEIYHNSKLVDKVSSVPLKAWLLARIDEHEECVTTIKMPDIKDKNLGALDKQHIGLAYMDLGDTKNAHYCLKISQLSEDSNDSIKFWAKHNLGVLGKKLANDRFRMGDIKNGVRFKNAAIRYQRKAIALLEASGVLKNEVDPHGPYYHLALLVDNPEEKITILTKGLEISPNAYRLHSQLSIAYAQHKNAAEARNHAKRSYKLAGEYRDPNIAMATYYLLNGAPNKAIYHIDRIIKKDPKSIYEDGSIDLLIGICYVMKGQLKKAKKQIKAAIEKGFDRIEGYLGAYMVMIGICYDLDHYSTAREYLNKAYELDPDHPNLKELNQLLTQGSMYKYV